MAAFMFAGIAPAAEPDVPRERAAQPAPAKPPRAVKESERQRTRTLDVRRFSCAVVLHGPVMTGSLHEDIHAQVSVSVFANITYEKVKVVAEFQAWSGSGDSYNPYPGGTETREFSNVSRSNQPSADFQRTVDGSKGGCRVDDQNPQRANCKYRVTARISYLKSTRGPVLGGSYSEGWKHGARCAADIGWAVFVEGANPF